MLTIVIPVYNRAALITRLLDSIYRQTVSNFSVIIVDNNSTDNTRAAVANWISAHKAADIETAASNVGEEGRAIDFKLVSETTPGAAAARNRGLREANTQYVCFYDSDDTLRPNFAETLLRGINSGDTPDLVMYTSAKHFPGGETKIAAPGNKRPLEKHILHSTLPTQGYAARTSFIKEIGEWNPEALVWDDWELGIRILLRQNLNIIPADPTPIADIFIQEDSITGPDFKSRADKIEQALQLAANDLKGNGYCLTLLDIVRARVAGRIRREGGKHQAKALLAGLQSKGKMKKLMFKGVYYHTLLFKRGCTLWAVPLARLLCRNSR